MLTVTTQAWGAGGPYPWFLFFPLFFPLFWLGFFLLGRRFWWRRAWAGSLCQPRGGAESALAHRFAEGEINEQEYRSRLAVLRETPLKSSGPQDTPP